ncbi:FtsW/RodA/SpoVE family cell cycle protein [Pseudonocardia sp. H11422]|uniref:FtsW/RodA/SpoVE family cell cycle protein n=1 Tax=Pseudonocardia sp. H11422 TaxID=2835866 RepID=UPI0027E2484C|nr:FtsW/RodA/SpoVE family cell cycle protein [Pseudonocardia sp. H11422]
MLSLERGRTDAVPGRERGSSRQRRRQRLGGAFDLLAVVAALVMVGLGLANLWAVDGMAMAVRQAVIAGVGVLLLALLWRFRVRLLTVLGWVCYGSAVLLLGAVLVVGLSANGATRWIGIGSFTFQPSELAKLGLLLVLAAVLGSDRPAWQRFALAVVLALVPIVLTVLQPDLSTTTLLVVLSVGMLVVGRIPARFLLPLFAAAAVLAPLVIGLLRPYQVERLGTFLTGSHESPSGSGWAVQQARIAVGSGAAFGQPGDPVNVLRAQYLPERETDLALASLVGQFGLLAGAAVVVAAIVLVWRLALASRAPRTPHGALVGSGLAILFGVETVVSFGGNLGLLPLAGVPFPLLSYGGTALVVHLAALGVVLGVRRDGARRRLWAVPRWRNRRPRMVRAVALGLSALLVAFGLYGWRLQADHGEALLIAAENQMTRCIRLPAERGMITDRHGAALAINAGGADSGLAQVVAVPALLRAAPDDVARLAALTGQPVEAVQSALDGVPATTLAVKVAEVPAATGAEVGAAEITGVLVVPELRRLYPTGPLLAPALGFAGVATPADVKRWPDLPPGEIVGRAGLEQQYDSVLRGLNGQQCVFVDPSGVPVAMGARTEPVPGATVRLSLDLGLQQRLTAGLAGALRGQKRSALGAAVAMDPRDGQILAIASLPSFDNNLYGPPVDARALQDAASAPGNPMLEHVTQASVPPGSTFKLVVAAANMVHPTFPPNQVLPTGAGFTLGGHTFGNWKPMGPMDLVQSIAWSNDVYFYKLATTMGPDPMIETARELGVGRPTGIDLPAESPGYLGTPDTVGDIGATWYGGSTVILGIGQGYLHLTPLQNARLTGAIATGNLVTPRLGLATGTDQSAFTGLPPSAATPLPFAGSLGPVRDGMLAAVTGGTARRLSDLGVPVGAKTGTAQDGALAADHYDNWMTAAAPMNDPTIVMTAMVQGPGLGSNNAGIVVHDAMRFYLDHQAEILATGPLQGSS